MSGLLVGLLRRCHIHLMIGLVGFGALLNACSPFVPATALPSPEPLQVVYTPAMASWQPILAQCAAVQPEIGLIVAEQPWPAAQNSTYDLLLQAAEPPPGFTGYAADLGSWQVVFASGSRAWTAERLTQAYRSNTPTTTPLWAYTPGSELYVPFTEWLLAGESLSPFVYLATDPGTMKKALEETPSAVGYLPRHLLPAGVSELTFMPAFELPLVALAKNEPQGEMRVYLACLQENQP